MLHSKDNHSFQKKCAIFLVKPCFVLAILHILSLEKQFIKNQYYFYYKFWKKGSLSYSESVVRNCSIRKIAHKILPKFTCNLIIKETPTQVYFCIVSKFLKKPILQNTCKWMVLDFEQFYMSGSKIHFIKRNWKKGNYFF